MKKSLPPVLPLTLDKCETDGQRIDWLTNRIADLEKECDAYRKDGVYGLYFSHNRKAMEIAESLNSFVLSFTSEGKEFERYTQLLKVQPEILKVLNALRKDYLKMDEETLEKIAATGVPLIEQRAAKKGK